MWGKMGQDTGPKHRSYGQNIMSKAAYRGKEGAFLFIYFFFIQPVLLFRCLIMPSCCTPLKQEMSESSQDPADASDGISFLHWLIKCSLDGRSTGFDFKNPSHWLEDLFKKKEKKSPRRIFDPALTDNVLRVSLQ